MRRPPSIDRDLLDPLTARYRNRAGRICRPDGSHFADVYLQTEVYWQRVGVFRRTWFDPRETIHGYEEYADGTFTDFVSTVSDLTDEIRRWNEGTWTLDGGAMSVEWLDDEATEAFRTEHGYSRPRY